jgi:hypothetical protein
LNRRTIDHLRHFLYGAVEPSKQLLDNFSFLRLLLASMGTIDYATLGRGWLGYAWHLPYGNKEALLQQMVKEGAIGSEDDCPIFSWLEYAMRHAADALRPVDKFYRPPSIPDAP